MRPKLVCSSASRFLIALLVMLVSTTPVWASHETILRDFVAFPHGANPQANLITDAAGSLYGTTPNGGIYGYGTVFRLTPGKNNDWNQTVLYSFTGGGDGASPFAGLIFDNAGNLYGTTVTGGTSEQGCQYSFTENGCGVVFELSPVAHGTWTESVLHSFTGSLNDGQTPIASLTLDSSGNLYGTTDGGGTYTAGTVFELSPGANGVWTETILYDFSGGADGAGPAANLIFDSVGNLYGTTEYGGDFNCNSQGYNTSCGTVFQLTPNGTGTWSETVLHTFTYSDGAYPLSSLVFDSAGNLYGTTSSGPGFACNQSGCGTVFRLTPNSDGSWTQAIIYNFEGGPDGADPVAGLVFDGSGNLYGTTAMGGFTGGTVFELTPTSRGDWSETILDRLGSGGVDGTNLGSMPMSALLLDQQGNLYGTASSGGNLEGLCYTHNSDGGCGTVFEVTRTNKSKWTARLVYAFPASGEGIGPSGLISDKSGNLYGVAQSGGARGYGVAFELMPQPGGSWKTVVLHTFVGDSDGAQPGSPLIFDQVGNLYGTTTNGGSQQCNDYLSCGGTIFELSPTAHGWKESILHRFSKNNNRGYQGPTAGLVLDSTGNLYGTTPEGGSTNCGSYGCGTVYKLSQAGGGKWHKQLLYSFQGGNDGSQPLNTLAFDDAGNLYGTTCGGGADSNGTVFKLAPNSDGKWKESVLYSFQGFGTGDGSCPYAGVIFDGHGNLYGTTFYGGSSSGHCYNNSGCGVVFELSPGVAGVWKETVLHAFQGNDGSNPESGLTFDAAGNLYGAAPFDGYVGFTGGVVFELSPDSKGWTEHVLHRFGKGFDGSGPNGALIFDSAGDIFGTTDSGGTDSFPGDGGGTVFELSPGPGGEWMESLTAPPSQLPRSTPRYP